MIDPGCRRAWDIRSDATISEPWRGGNWCSPWRMSVFWRFPSGAGHSLWRRVDLRLELTWPCGS